MNDIDRTYFSINLMHQSNQDLKEMMRLVRTERFYRAIKKIRQRKTTEYGCFRLASRICALKKQGWEIARDIETKNDKRYAKYFITH